MAELKRSEVALIEGGAARAGAARDDHDDEDDDDADDADHNSVNVTRRGAAGDDVNGADKGLGRMRSRRASLTSTAGQQRSNPLMKRLTS